MVELWAIEEAVLSAVWKVEILAAQKDEWQELYWVVKWDF